MCRIALSLSILFLPWCLSADTAEDYFHRGAQYYVWGQKQKSQAEITSGLTLYPTDALLNGMAKLLQKEEQQQNQQQQQQQNQQDQQNQQQQSQPQQSQESQKQEQQPQQEQEQQQQQQPEQQNQEQQAAAAQEEKASEEKEAAQAKAEGRMTPEEARQLLDAQKGDEQYLNLQQNQKPRDRNRPVKDW